MSSEMPSSRTGLQALRLRGYLRRGIGAPTLALALVACAPSSEGEISQEARDAYQDKRLDALESAVERIEAAARQQQLQATPPRAAVRESEESATLDAGEIAPRARATPEPMAVDLLDASARAVETNNTWWRFAWKVAVRNNLDRAIQVKVSIQFLDQDGFVLEEDSERVTLQPYEERDVSDFDLINADTAPRVASVKGSLSL